MWIVAIFIFADVISWLFLSKWPCHPKMVTISDFLCIWKRNHLNRHLLRIINSKIGKRISPSSSLGSRKTLQDVVIHCNKKKKKSLSLETSQVRIKTKVSNLKIQSKTFYFFLLKKYNYSIECLIDKDLVSTGITLFIRKATIFMRLGYLQGWVEESKCNLETEIRKNNKKKKISTLHWQISQNWIALCRGYHSLVNPSGLKSLIIGNQ